LKYNAFLALLQSLPAILAGIQALNPDIIVIGISVEIFNETRIPKATRSGIRKSNYPRSEAERDSEHQLHKRSAVELVSCNETQTSETKCLKFAGRIIPKRS
jgi:hypothetical protein